MTTIQKNLIATAALGLLGTLAYEANVIRVQRLQIQELTATLNRERSPRQAGIAASAPNPSPATGPANSAGNPTSAGRDGIVPTNASAASHLRELMQLNPQYSIPELGLLDDKDWSEIAATGSFDTDEGRRRAFKALRDAAKDKLAQRLIVAIREFAAQSGGQLPADPSQLLPYLSLELPAGVLPRYQMMMPNRKLGERPEVEWR